MSKLKFYIVLVLTFLFCFNFVSASVVFNEVSLLPTEDRFIELYNSGNSTVDLTNWYIQRKTSTSENFGSLISKTYFDGVEIKAGGYLLISKSSLANSDIVVDNLTLTDSNTIQIKNSTQEVVDLLEWDSIPSSKSWQRISGDWVLGNITPGKTNTGGDILDDNNENTIENEDLEDNSNSSNKSNTISKIEDKTPRKVIATIISPKIVFEGTPFKINSLITTNKKETLAVGKFKWNFGDGSIKEDTSSQEFEHVYFYPGEYVLSLNYYERKSSSVDDLDRITIKVVPREISISGVGDINDPYIEIENKSNYEITLSGWTITGGMHYFKIPDGTVLLANKKLKFSGKVTFFVSEDLNIITLTNSNGEIVASYPQSNSVNKKVYTNSNLKQSKENINIQKDYENDEVVNLNDLGASALDSQTISSGNYAYWGLGILIIIGMASILLFRSRKEKVDYLEDEISSNDIKILE